METQTCRPRTSEREAQGGGGRWAGGRVDMACDPPAQTLQPEFHHRDGESVQCDLDAPW